VRFSTNSRSGRAIVFSLVVLAGSISTLRAGIGTLETPSFKITVDVRCPEGEVICDDVTYVGVNKKSGETVSLTGKTLHHLDADGTPTRFLGYIFKNKDVTYFLSEDGQLRISRGEEVLLKENGTWTW